MMSPSPSPSSTTSSSFGGNAGSKDDDDEDNGHRRHREEEVGDSDDDPWTYRGRRLRHLDFPLGGIGTGNILLQGDGCLRGWDVLNQFHSPEHRRLHNPPPLGTGHSGGSNNNEKSNNCNCWAISAAYDDEEDEEEENPSRDVGVVRDEDSGTDDQWIMVEKLPRPSILLRSANHYGIRDDDGGADDAEPVSGDGNGETRSDDARLEECRPREQRQQRQQQHPRKPDIAASNVPEDVPEISVRARYPIARVSYETQPSFPLTNIRMEVMTPLVPSDSKKSGYPLAVFVVSFDNPHPTKSVSVDVMQSTLNFLGWDGGRKRDGVPSLLWGGNCNEPFAHTSTPPTDANPKGTSTDPGGSTNSSSGAQYSCQGLFLHTKDDLKRDLTRKGSIALFAIVRSESSSSSSGGGGDPSGAKHDSSGKASSASAPTATVGLVTGVSSEDELFRRFRTRDFDDVDPDGGATPPSPEGTTYAGAVVQSFSKIPPSSTVSVTFGLSWHFPYRPCTTPRANLPRDFYGNLYSSWFASAREVAEKFCDTFAADENKKKKKNLLEVTRSFVEALYGTTIPWEILESAAGRLAIARSPTLFRTEAGIVLGTEGNGRGPLNGTHVFGYTTLLERVFPDLAKDMLTSAFVRNFDLGGGGCLTSFGEGGFAIDGALASIAKVHLAVLQSDPGLDFLRSVWPNLKRQLGLVLDKQVTKDGVIVGPQQTTYGGSLRGANTLVGSHLLAALRATEAMADLVGDVNFAKKCSKQAAASLEGYERLCWRDDLGHYVANTDEHDARHHAAGSYTYGTGCCIGQLAGSALSRACGFGSVFDPAREARARRSILRLNAVSDPPFVDENHRLGPGDSGLRVCTYPPDEAERMPRSDEVASGLEYNLAAGLVDDGGDGDLEDAVRMLGSIRRRQSGIRRSPWNEPESGLYAARSMAGWDLLDRSCGFRYDSTAALLRVLPATIRDDGNGGGGNGSSDGFFFFSCVCIFPKGFGEFRQRRKPPRTGSGGDDDGKTTTTTTTVFSLKVLHGSVELRTVHVDDATANAVAVTLDGDERKASISAEGGGVVSLESKLVVEEGSTLELILSRAAPSADGVVKSAARWLPLPTAPRRDGRTTAVVAAVLSLLLCLWSSMIFLRDR